LNPPKSPKTQVFYAVVLHDFVAERADELDAKRGDAISVVAQSNREWFVAKPIGKLGRPGLIPVTFVEIRDPATNLPITDVDALMDHGDLPKVEDWKRAMFNYKQNSIALGVIEDSRGGDSVVNSPFMPQKIPQKQPAVTVEAPLHRDGSKDTGVSQPSTTPCLPDGILLSADVISFHYEMDEFWFRIDAIFQPFPPPGERTLPSAMQLILFRVYNDFYDFQVSLLDTFPREAGRKPPHPRMLPYMPGPAENVDTAITTTRRVELDDYMHKLCELNSSGAQYILEHQVVREFLALKPGDVENEVPPRTEEMVTLFGYDYNGQDKADVEPADGYGGEMRTKMKKMRISGEHSDGSDYEDEGYAPSPLRQESRHPYAQTEPPIDRRPNGGSQNSLNLRQHAHAQNHERMGSNPALPRAPSPTSYPSSSPSNSPLRERLPRSFSPTRPGTGRTVVESESDYSRWGDNNPPTSSPSSATRSRSQSNAVSNLNNPPISASNPQPAFVKIKIFDRSADELIAIRVHPKVTHYELMDKVRVRLGGDFSQLRYRDSYRGVFVGLSDDADLTEWLENTDKHVLYAD
jgi:bud emergence protein 1